MTADWRSLIARGPADALAEKAGALLGLSLPPAAFRSECLRAAARAEESSGRLLGQPCRGEGWSDGAWWSWLKARAVALEVCRAEGSDLKNPRRASCLLHVGFVAIEETAEHWASLRRKPEPGKSDAPARSRIGSTNEVICPVDRTAAMVVPGC